MIARSKRLIALLLALTLHPLSRLAPRSAKHWAFGHAGDIFAGNPRYLFLWMALHRPDIRVTWITGDRAVLRQLAAAGYRARARWSAGGMLAALRSGVFVFGHGLGNVNVHLSGGAFLLNLWHGVGLKPIHLGFGAGRTAQARRQATALGRLAAREYLQPYDALVTTSDMMQAHFAQQTELPVANCPQLGYPRLDCVADAALAEAVDQLDRAAGFAWDESFAETYIYMPTYRDTGRPFLDQALPDPARLSAVLAARGALLYVKPHPQTSGSVAATANIRAWPAGIDVNAYLARFTGLITDYSSVLYDYLFVRPTGAMLYVFDHDDYIANDRTLLYPFDENVAGLRVNDFDALCAALGDGAALGEEGAADVERIRRRFWGGSSLPASPAIVAYVEGRLDHDSPQTTPGRRPDVAPGVETSLPEL